VFKDVEVERMEMGLRAHENEAPVDQFRVRRQIGEPV
jgi:hypothetical protein